MSLLMNSLYNIIIQQPYTPPIVRINLLMNALINTFYFYIIITQLTI